MTLTSFSVSMVAVLILHILFLQGSFATTNDLRHRVVYAVNAGGDALVGSNGIQYLKDPCREGISSNYGQSKWTFGREDGEDTPLFQTERYSLSTFGYDIPLVEDGDYVLVLYFSEVYFLHPNKKVFDVHLNNVEIIKDLDIFSLVGHGTAHEELVPFTISNGLKTLSVYDVEVPISNKRLRLNFVKGKHDNPKVNAFFVLRGGLEDVPRLSLYQKPEPDYSETEDWEEPDDENESWDNGDSVPSQGAESEYYDDPYPEKDWTSWVIVGGSLIGGGIVTLVFKFLL